VTHFHFYSVIFGNESLYNFKKLILKPAFYFDCNIISTNVKNKFGHIARKA